jgi:tetratricopeptide (TPR) repeat protein
MRGCAGLAPSPRVRFAHVGPLPTGERVLICIASALLLCCAANAEDWGKDWQQLCQARDRNDVKACMEKGTAMLKVYAKDVGKVTGIYDIMTNCYRRASKWDDAIAMYEKQIKEIADNVDMERTALNGIAETLRDANRWPKSIEAYRKLIARFPKEGTTCANARLQIGYIIKDRLQKPADSIPEFEEVEKADPKNLPNMASALCGMGDAYMALNDFVKAYPCYRRMLDEFSKDQPPWVMQTVKRNAIRALTTVKNWPEALAFLARFEEIEPDEPFRSELAFNHAEVLRASGEKAKARADYVRAQSLYPTEEGFLYTCQTRIVELLIEEGNFPEALSAAKVLFDIAWDEERMVQACAVVASRLKAIDGNLSRANTFLKFQKFGPQGEDGKGPIANPLKDVPYPADPERLKALKAGLDRAGDSAVGARQRALLWILQGQPKEALKEFRLQFARGNEDLLQRAANEWVLIGVKAARGQATGLAPYFDWLNYGAAGKDGKAQAANPFETLP